MREFINAISGAQKAKCLAILLGGWTLLLTAMVLS